MSVNLIIAQEDFLELFFRDSSATVGHGEFHYSAVMLFEGDYYLSALVSIFDGVGEQVVEDVDNFVRVGIHKAVAL